MNFSLLQAVRISDTEAGVIQGRVEYAHSQPSFAEQRTAQLRVKKNCIIAEGGGGTIFWATPTRARLLIDGGGAELVNVGPAERPAAGPSETQIAGPSEFKEPAEKKYSAAGPGGRLIDSVPSTGSGAGAVSSVSAAALVSPQRNAPPLVKRGRGRPRKSA